MTRTRAYLLATLSGILITTGGCADSATAPTAAAGPAFDRAQLDTTTTTSNRPPSQDDGDITVQSGLMKGGG